MEGEYRVRGGGGAEVGSFGAVRRVFDGEYLVQRLVDRFELPSKQGHTKFGRVRVTAVRLEKTGFRKASGGGADT